MVRVLVVLAALVGCYAPSTPSGAPCDPSADNCPADQACRPANGGHVCGAPGSDIDASASSIDAASDAQPAAIDATSIPVQRTYVASVAECIDPNLPDPQRCRDVNGETEMVVDLRDSGTGNPWEAFIRFDLDGAIAGKTVTSATLRLVATSNPKADASNTGELWQVQPFTPETLKTTTPPRIGLRLDGTQGAVVELQPISWTVPPTIVVANGSVYLSIKTTVASGVNYWNLNGPNPPQLIVNAE